MLHMTTKLGESAVFATTSLTSVLGMVGLAQADLGSIDKIASLGALGVISTTAIALWIRSEMKRDADRKSSDQVREKLTDQFVSKQEAMSKEFTTAIERNTNALNANTNAVREVASFREIIDTINHTTKRKD